MRLSPYYRPYFPFTESGETYEIWDGMFTLLPYFYSDTTVLVSGYVPVRGFPDILISSCPHATGHLTVFGFSTLGWDSICVLFLNLPG